MQHADSQRSQKGGHLPPSCIHGGFYAATQGMFQINLAKAAEALPAHALLPTSACHAIHSHLPSKAEQVIRPPHDDLPKH